MLQLKRERGVTHRTCKAGGVNRLSHYQLPPLLLPFSHLKHRWWKTKKKKKRCSVSSGICIGKFLSACGCAKLFLEIVSSLEPIKTSIRMDDYCQGDVTDLLPSPDEH
ncbi:hypothetical protein BgiBS90_026977 [Biomphalaria glabrata]|nr:hypothetical protein BgiBS90_026977 [Biomphalaria glabrata]